MREHEEVPKTESGFCNRMIAKEVPNNTQTLNEIPPFNLTTKTIDSHKNLIE
jgi:hypothetical protein